MKSESKDGSVFESKTYREQRKAGINILGDKKKKYDNDKKENSTREDDQGDDSDKGYKKDKRDKFKESPREQKSKKYSDTRKERIKQTEFVKSEKQSVINKIMSSDTKVKSINHDDIKPFTQLPHVKTDDLTKIIEGMDKKMKLEESNKDAKSKDSNDETFTKMTSIGVSKIRRSSLESGELAVEKDESVLKRQKSLDDRGKSTDREESEEKEKSDSGERRAERRIRNKVTTFLYLLSVFLLLISSLFNLKNHLKEETTLSHNFKNHNHNVILTVSYYINRKRFLLALRL